eukprot:2356839-Amphidinium_carterae.1
MCSALFSLKSYLQGRLEDLAAVSEDLHTQCDYFLKNFDVRQKARLQEIEAIQSAKASDTVPSIYVCDAVHLPSHRFQLPAGQN